MLMVNRLLLASLVLLAGAHAPALAADGGLDGNYKLDYIVGTNQMTLTMVKLETKDGKLEGSVVAGGQIGAKSVSKVSADGKLIRFDVGGRNPGSFEGIVSGDVVNGSFEIGSNLFTAQLVKTTEEKMPTGQGAVTQLKVPEYTDGAKLETAVLILQGQERREKDKEKKAELTKKIAEAKEKAALEVPKHFLQLLEKHADSPLVMTAGQTLLKDPNFKLSVDDARKWIAASSTVAEKYGPRLAAENRMKLAEILGPNADLKVVALEMVKKAEAALTDKSSTEDRVRVMKALLPALKNNAKLEESKTVEVELAKLETVLDHEYVAKVPPFKPEMFEGRKEKGDRKVVFELFTGAECPPCVAADVAFDALSKTYKPAELILLQYHLHIPGPDPLVNADTEARANYYNFHSTPSTAFNGKTPLKPNGGPMAASEELYGQYRKVIDPILEEKSEPKLLVTATQSGNKIDIKAEVNGLKDPGEKKRLRLVLTEETIRYVGGNKLRFHHHVVRAMPGGVEGFELKAENSQHSATVNLDELRANLIKYLDNAAQARPFRYPDRPLDLKHLKVVGLIQDDTSKEILNVLQVDIGGEVTTRLGTEK
jgi:hypothetical protein